MKRIILLIGVITLLSSKCTKKEEMEDLQPIESSEKVNGDVLLGDSWVMSAYILNNKADIRKKFNLDTIYTFQDNDTVYTSSSDGAKYYKVLGDSRFVISDDTLNIEEFSLTKISLSGETIIWSPEDSTINEPIPLYIEFIK